MIFIFISLAKHNADSKLYHQRWWRSEICSRSFRFGHAPIRAVVAIGHAPYIIVCLLDTPPEWLSLATVWVSRTCPPRPVPELLEKKCHVMSCPDDGVIPPFTGFFIIYWPQESFSLLWLPEKVKTTGTQKICDQTAKHKLAEVCFKGFFFHSTAELSPSKGLGRNLEKN